MAVKLRIYRGEIRTGNFLLKFDALAFTQAPTTPFRYKADFIWNRLKKWGNGIGEKYGSKKLWPYDLLIDKFNAVTDAMMPGHPPLLKCKELYDLLELLFKPEEAELAAKMPAMPADSETIARDMGAQNPQEVERLLEGMLSKNLIMCFELEGGKKYLMWPGIQGIIETQFHTDQI